MVNIYHLIHNNTNQTDRKNQLYLIAIYKCIWHTLTQEAKNYIKDTEQNIDTKPLPPYTTLIDIITQHNDNINDNICDATTNVAITASIHNINIDLVGIYTDIYPEKLPTINHNDDTIHNLAQTIYNTQDYSILPILRDALINAGCTDKYIIRHCKQKRHYKGCWLIDTILGHQIGQKTTTHHKE